MKQCAGGFKLAQRLLNWWLHSYIRVYYYGTKQCWTWFTYQCKHVRTPQQGLKFFIRQATGAWKQHIRGIFTDALETPAHLVALGLDPMAGPGDLPMHQKVAASLAEFTVCLASNRAWSCIAYEAPPYRYAGFLSSRGPQKEAAAADLRADAACLYSLEAVAHEQSGVRALLADTADLFCAPIRILYLTAERDKWRAQSSAARRHLATLLTILPDNKTVEDVHQHPRDLQRT